MSSRLSSLVTMRLFDLADALKDEGHESEAADIFLDLHRRAPEDYPERLVFLTEY